MIVPINVGHGLLDDEVLILKREQTGERVMTRNLVWQRVDQHRAHCAGCSLLQRGFIIGSSVIMPPAHTL